MWTTVFLYPNMKLCNWYEIFGYYLSIKWRSQDYYFFVSKDLYGSMHANACIEVHDVSITKPAVMDTISVDFVLKPAVICLSPYKKEPGKYPCTHPHFTFIYQFHVFSLLTLFTLCDLVMAPRYFIVGIYMFSSLTL